MLGIQALLRYVCRRITDVGGIYYYFAFYLIEVFLSLWQSLLYDGIHMWAVDTRQTEYQKNALSELHGLKSKQWRWLFQVWHAKSEGRTKWNEEIQLLIAASRDIKIGSITGIQHHRHSKTSHLTPTTNVCSVTPGATLNFPNSGIFIWRNIPMERVTFWSKIRS